MIATAKPMAHFVESSAKENFMHMMSAFAIMDEPLFSYLAMYATDDNAILEQASHATAGQPTCLTR